MGRRDVLQPPRSVKRGARNSGPCQIGRAAAAGRAVGPIWRKFEPVRLRQGFGGHAFAQEAVPGGLPPEARRAKGGGPGRTRTCNQTVMSGRL